MKASTINARFAMLSVVFNYHKIPKDLNLLKSIRKLPDPNKHGRKRILSIDDEFARILQHEPDEELRDIYSTCYYTAARVGITAVRLEKDECDLENEVINVPPEKNKGMSQYKKGYTIPIDGRIFQVLYRRKYETAPLTVEEAKRRYSLYCKGLNDKQIGGLVDEAENYLFPSVVFYGWKKFACRVGDAFKSACKNKKDKKASVKNACIHDCRRSAGTRFYNRTKDLYKTMKFLGHLNPNTTAKYLHIEVTDLFDGVEPVKDNPLRRKYN